MNESNVNIIGDFLNQNLSEKDRETFLQKLETDAELKTDFEKIQLLQKVAERNRILEQAKQIHDKKVRELTASKGKTISWVQISSAAVAACLIFTLYLGNSDFEYTEISQVERGDATADSSLGDFDAGMNSLKEKQPEKALEYFNKTINNQELTDYYRDAARWYKVVAFAEMDKDDEAKNLLNQIENSAGFTYKISWIEKLKMKVRMII